MSDDLARIAAAMPAWMNAVVQRGIVISELLINLRVLPSGEVELTITPPPNPLGPTTLSDSDTVLQLAGSVDEFVDIARQLDALFTPTE